MKAHYTIVMLLILGGLMSCSSKMATIDTKEIEKLRVDYNKGKLETIEDLIAIYKDPVQPMETRIAALQVMAQTEHPDAIKIMHDFLNQSVGVNYALLNATASALIDHATPENVAAMVGGVVAAQKKYIDFRTAVMTKMQSVDVKLQVEQLLNLYQSEKENYVQMQESLTKLLGSVPDDRVIPILISVAKDNSVKISVRSLAFEILGKKRNPLVTQTFIEMLGDPEQQLVLRDFAIKSIEDVQESRVILALLETLNQGREEYYVLVGALTNAMGDYSDTAVIPALIEIVKNPEFPLETRKKAITALTKFKSLDAFKQLLPMMETPDGYVMFDEITRMASETGNPEAFVLLRRAALKAQQTALGVQ